MYYSEKIIYVFLLMTTVFTYGNHCLSDLGMHFINESVVNDEPLPAYLVHPDQRHIFNNEYIELLNRISVAHLFKLEDFFFSIVNRSEGFPEHASVSYTIKPTHEIHIFNRNWNPAVPVLVAAVYAKEQQCYLLIPSLKDESFKSEKLYYDKLFDSVLSHLDSISKERAKSLLERFMTSDDYGRALREISGETGMDEDHALFLLSLIKRDLEQKNSGKP